MLNSKQSVVGCIATTATEHSSVIVQIPSVWKFPHLAYGWLRFTLICSREKCLKRLLKNTRSFVCTQGALHVSLKEKRILSSCVDDIRREFHHGADSYKRTILIRHITRLLDYTTRFYERQFIVRELNNELLIRQYEKLVKQYIGDGKLAQKPLTSAYCAGQLHLSEAYFNDLLELQLGHTHSCHLQLKRIEMAKEKLRSSGESLSQIVHELGFPSIQYFSFLFKKITGITPNSYRSLN